MQLNKLPSQAKVLTLATGLMVSTPVFAYSDLDNLGNILTTRKNVDYMRAISSVEEFDIAQKFKFQMHLNAWEQKTMFSSSVATIVNDEDFQAIVGMGIVAVPFIKEEIERKPSVLVWALNYIYGSKISDKPDLTITEACNLWIKAIS